MRIAERFANADKHRDDLFEGRLDSDHPNGQVIAVDVLLNNVGHTVLFLHIVDGDETRVPQVGSRTGFVKKVGNLLW